MDFEVSRIKDYEYYAPRMLKIKTMPPNPQIIPLIANPIQVRLRQLIKKEQEERGFVRINVLKARREGVSTDIEGHIFHAVHTTPNTHAFIVAHDKDGLNTIFDMAKLMYECLDPKYKPMKRYSSRKELVFENPNDKTRFLEPGLRSKIEVFSANKVTASRSGGYSYAHFSEVAFYEHAEELLTAVVPSIPDVPGTFIVRESTANGRGDFFHNEWLLAEKGQSNYRNIFFSWLEFPLYSLPLPTTKARKQLQSTLDEEEKHLMKKYHATLEQLFWRRAKLLDYHGDVDKFHQEYPCDAKEAFIASGQSYFSRDRIREYMGKTVEPIFTGDITQYGLQPNEEGDLDIWEMPEKGREYVLGVDVGGGQDSGDNSVIEVLKVPVGNPIIEQVAEYTAKLDPVLLAEKCIRVARLYNEGMLSIEINNHGLTTLNEVKEQFWNLYRWQYFDRFGKTITNKLGWDCVTPQTKILTNDLRWVPASELVVGDKIIGCEEERIDSSRGGHRFKNQEVLKIREFQADLFHIVLDNETITTVSNNHPFLVSRGLTNKISWVRADQLQYGDSIRYIPPWEPLQTYNAGRLSGLLDGEGYFNVDKTNGSVKMMIAQAEGLISDEVERLWYLNGFEPTMKHIKHQAPERAHHKTMVDCGLGQAIPIITALGKLRPLRLLERFLNENLMEHWTTRICKDITVLAAIPAGQGTVLGIETSGHTLIADGLVSHNTNVSTRPLLCDYATACVNANIIVIRSETLVDEMQTFIKREQGYGGEGEYGSYDDHVMAFMIGLFTLAHSHQSSSLLTELGTLTMTPVVSETPGPRKVITLHNRDLLPDFALESGEKELTSGERGWLNY